MQLTFLTFRKRCWKQQEILKTYTFIFYRCEYEIILSYVILLSLFSLLYLHLSTKLPFSIECAKFHSERAITNNFWQNHFREVHSRHFLFEIESRLVLIIAGTEMMLSIILRTRTTFLIT